MKKHLAREFLRADVDPRGTGKSSKAFRRLLAKRAKLADRREAARDLAREGR